MLSPVIPMFLLVVMATVCAAFSPGRMLENHSMLFLVATAGPIVKMVLHMMVRSVTDHREVDLFLL